MVLYPVQRLPPGGRIPTATRDHRTISARKRTIVGESRIPEIVMSCRVVRFVLLVGAVKLVLLVALALVVFLVKRMAPGACTGGGCCHWHRDQAA
jgi:hypothetical protein